MDEQNFINSPKLLPKNIDIISHEIGINELIKYLEKGEILFQNSGKNGRLANAFTKSKIIENILLNIPLPTLYLDRTDKGKFRPIDTFGYEFLYAIQDFIKNKFALTNLEFLTRLNNLTYEQIPESDRRTIFWRVISFRYLTSNTPNLEKYVIINRFTSGKGVFLQAHDFVPQLLDIYKSISENSLQLLANIPLKNSNIRKLELLLDKEHISGFIALYLNAYALNDEVTFDYFKNKTLLSLDIEQGEIVEKIQKDFYRAFEKLISLLNDKQFSANFSYFTLLFVLSNQEHSQKIEKNKTKFFDNLTQFSTLYKYRSIYFILQKLNEIIANL